MQAYPVAGGTPPPGPSVPVGNQSEPRTSEKWSADLKAVTNPKLQSHRHGNSWMTAHPVTTFLSWGNRQRACRECRCPTPRRKSFVISTLKESQAPSDESEARCSENCSWSIPQVPTGMIRKYLILLRDNSGGHLPWARGSPVQELHSVSLVFSLSNNLGNLLFARQATQVTSAVGVLEQFWLSRRADAHFASPVAAHAHAHEPKRLEPRLPVRGLAVNRTAQVRIPRGEPNISLRLGTRVKLLVQLFENHTRVLGLDGHFRPMDPRHFDQSVEHDGRLSALGQIRNASWDVRGGVEGENQGAEADS